MKNWISERSLFLYSCIVVVFAYGVAVGRYQLFPYSVIFSSVEMFFELQTRAGIRPHPYLRPARYSGDGVTRLVKSQAYPGLTLLSGFFENGNELRIVNGDGLIINRWPVKFSEIFPSPTHIEPGYLVPKTDWNVEVHGALAEPDGSVVFSFEGAGLAKLDRCGTVQWTVPRVTHHSVERSKDGGYWVPGMRYVQDDFSLPPIPPPFLEDTILKLSQDGQVVEEISVPALLLKNNLQGLLYVRMMGMEIPYNDLTHLNDIEELSEEIASQFPLFSPGDILLSVRELNLIMVVDPNTEIIKWYQIGPWFYQHDPDFQSNGRISVFSNNNDGTDTGSIMGGSTIVEVDPKSGMTAITYGGSEAQIMFTPFRGKHQNLDNGNLLVTESDAGRVFEVNSEGEVVWEFINRYNEDEVAIITQATRYPEEFFSVKDWRCP